MPDDTGETRRERNTRLQIPSPVFNLPDSGSHIWQWFGELSSIARSNSEGVYRHILPSEYLAWQQITRNIVYSWEYDILFSMDVAFCDEVNKEIEARESARRERAQREAELNSRGR